MSNKIELIKHLLEYVESYDNEHNNSDLRSFSIYLKDIVFCEKKTETVHLSETDYANYKRFPEVELSTLLTTLYRFATKYMRKTFQNTEIKTVDEFGFLATLLKEKSLLKSELINKHLLEITTGTELLKRLINKGLIIEIGDETDKRAKRVSLSEKGAKELTAVFQELFVVSKIIRGNLTDKELNETISIFTKLSNFHWSIFNNDRNASIREIYKKHIEK
ncbi:MAG TPA: hypothetical protein DCG69_08845 [Bacteroidales bacterium]|nr:hypothetical protein [Bacteroidales bacterium]